MVGLGGMDSDLQALVNNNLHGTWPNAPQGPVQLCKLVTTHTTEHVQWQLSYPGIPPVHRDWLIDSERIEHSVHIIL